MEKQSALFDGVSTVDRGADISSCGRYRYRLWRRWDDRPSVNFVMLNPSTADATLDDPTIRRCVGFARTWGYGGIVVTNLYAFRATCPRDLWGAADPVGPGNDEAIRTAAVAAGLLVCAWGNHGSVDGRAAAVLDWLRRIGVTPHALKVTGAGQPAHPLYLPAAAKPTLI